MKSVINSLDEVNENIRGEYESRDGKFHLKIEDTPRGFVKAEDLLAANSKVVEFRDRNIGLMKKIDEELNPKLQRFDGIDPDKAREALEKIKTLGAKGVGSAEDIENRVAAMVEAAIKPLKEQVSLSAATAEAERRRADEYLLKTHITDTFAKQGGNAKATDFVVNLAKDSFEVKDGKVVAKVGQFSKENPGDPLSPTEWLKNIAGEHDYVFKPSTGGGTPPIKGSGTTPGQLKPGQTLLKNPTPQQLGEFSADIAAGKIKVVHEQTT